MRIGHSTIQRMRVPAFLKGQMILFDLASVQGQWSIACRFPPFEFGEAIILNQFQRTVQNNGAVLLGLLPFDHLFLDTRLPKTKILRIPLLSDPLQRLHRVFGLTEKPATNRYQSYVIDPKGVIRYHLVHQLNWRGFSFLVEILNHCQEQGVSSLIPSLGLRLSGSTSPSRYSQKRGALSSRAKISILDCQGGSCYATKPTA